MKNISIDLVTSPLVHKSKGLLYFFSIAGSILWIVSLGSFIWYGKWYFLLNTICFLYLSVESYLNLNGRTFEEFLGKSYLKMNDETCIYKPKKWKEERCILWVELQCIQFKSLNLIFVPMTGDDLKLDLGSYSYKEILDVKGFVREKAEIEGIEMRA